MEKSLYHPMLGYYMRDTQKLGRQGDFFTSAHVGSMFGKILSQYFQTLIQRETQSDEPITIVEMGAGDGRLLRAIASALEAESWLKERICFAVIEISSYHRKLQQEQLKGITLPIYWVNKLEELSNDEFTLVFSNELVDAFPIHRLRKMNTEWQELWIEVNDQNEKKECWETLSHSELLQYLKEFQLFDLPAPVQIEANLFAKTWLESISQWMKRGYLITIDYGGAAKEEAMKPQGTFRCYQEHQMSETPYGQEGFIDMTTNVHFDALAHWGNAVGLEQVYYGKQTEFLLQQGIFGFYQPEIRDPFHPKAKQNHAIRQLLYGMGGQFQVLVQRKKANP